MKRIIMLLIVTIFGICLIGCNSNDKVEFNSEKIKQNLKSYVNDINKSETIKCNLTLVENIINNEVDEFEKDDYLKNSVQMENKVKKEIDKLILTKDLETRIKEDYKKSKYRDIYGEDINPISRCYGVYNEAVAIFIQLEEYVETTILVKNYSFYYPNNFVILVWNNGSFYSFESIKDIDELLNNNILLLKDIDAINRIHNEWFE